MQTGARSYTHVRMCVGACICVSVCAFHNVVYGDLCACKCVLKLLRCVSLSLIKISKIKIWLDTFVVEREHFQSLMQEVFFATIR